jgi:hypothetical protein
MQKQNLTFSPVFLLFLSNSDQEQASFCGMMAVFLGKEKTF